MRIIFVCICVAVAVQTVNSAMTEAQMKSAAKLLRNVCQPKSKATNAQIEVLHAGTFTQEKETMSYMECILRTGQIMKDAKLNYEFLRSQLLNAPASISEGALISAEHCKDKVTSSDKYEAAFEFYKCFYEDNPSNFFLP